MRDENPVLLRLGAAYGRTNSEGNEKRFSYHFGGLDLGGQKAELDKFSSATGSFYIKLPIFK